MGNYYILLMLCPEADEVDSFQRALVDPGVDYWAARIAYMGLLLDHISAPLDRYRVGDSPRQGIALASDGTARSGPSSEVSPRCS